MSGYLVQALTILAVTVPVSCAAISDCVQTRHQAGDTAAIAAEKAEYAIAAISNSKYLAKNPQCIKANISYLGQAKMEHQPVDLQKVIPLLIPLLGYYVDRVGHRPTAPAVDALYQIGEPAVPALLEVLATRDSDAIESKNAVDAIMDIYREDLDKGLRALKQAAQNETDALRASHREHAVQDARDRWCRLSPCME